MGIASVATTATILLMAAIVRGEDKCESGPPPPSDLAFFIWVNSGFEPQGDTEENAAEKRLGKADFLCQDHLELLITNFSTIIPMSEVDFRTSCSFPVEGSCMLLSSCSDAPSAGRRRLTQRCIPFFGCSYTVIVGSTSSTGHGRSRGEDDPQPPALNQTMSVDVALGICFEGSCNIIVTSKEARRWGINEGIKRGMDRDLLGAVAYGTCPEKYAMEAVDGWTALHRAAIMDAHYSAVEKGIKALVDHGADLEARGAEGFTPMHMAAKWGSLTPLQEFINLGADLEAKDSTGNTPLVVASVFGRSDVIEALLKAGANPNVRYLTTENPSLASKTPLHFASLYSGKSEIVEMLIQAGADVKSIDEGGNTPLQIAESYGRTAVVAILKKHNAR